ncbi:MAG: TrmH family RNA methyltransferase, partial [bacterium]
LAKMSYREEPEGVLALVEIPQRAIPQDATLILVAVGIEKPGNLGAMVRTTAAVGANGVLVADGGTDPFNPNVVRTSTGAIYSLPLVIERGPVLRAWLRDRGVRLVIATPEAAEPWDQVDFTGPTALVIGAEDIGVDAIWREAALEDGGVSVSLPVECDNIDSLNAGTTAGILLYEALRQRRASQR